jgi:hypothetical protein
MLHRVVEVLLTALSRSWAMVRTVGHQLGTATWWPPAPVLISVCALFFTVASFWWLNARRGRLKSFEPHTFSAGMPSHIVRLRFPLVLYNTGAVPAVVQSLRLCFPKEPGSEPLPWVGWRTQIKPDNPESHDFPAVFSVPGRTARQIFVEFGAPSLGFTLESRDYPARIEVILGHKKKWKRLLRFTFQAGQISTPDNYITYGKRFPLSGTPPGGPMRRALRWRLRGG